MVSIILIVQSQQIIIKSKMQNYQQSKAYQQEVQITKSQQIEQTFTFMDKNAFIEQNSLEDDFFRTPKFYSDVCVDLLNQSKYSRVDQRINKFLCDLQGIGIEIESVSEQEIQNINEQQSFLEQNSNVYQQRKQTECTFAESKQLSIVNSLPFDIIRESCIYLKGVLKRLPSQIKQAMRQLKEMNEQMNKRVVTQFAQYTSKLLVRKDQEIQQILKRQQLLKQQKRQLQKELRELAQTYQELKDQTSLITKEREEKQYLLTSHKQFQILQCSNLQQSNLIQELYQKIRSLREQIAFQKKQFIKTQKECEQFRFDLQRKYEVAFEETKQRLCRQIEIEMYFKLKYGYHLDVESAENMKLLLEIWQNKELAKSQQGLASV